MAETTQKTKKEVEKTEDKKVEKNKSVKITDEMLVKCKSTCSNLFFASKDGGSVEWETADKIQELTVRELREMKASQQRFFSDGWIIILGLSDSEESDVSAESIYKALGLTRYYETLVDISKIREIIKWSDEEIQEKVKLMSTGMQENLLVALNKSIKNGVLDSIKKIKAFQTALGCELVSI